MTRKRNNLPMIWLRDTLHKSRVGAIQHSMAQAKRTANNRGNGGSP